MSKKHPYQGLPTYQFWKEEPGIENPNQFDPVTKKSFLIDKTDAVVTAGSCFAQHVARYLNRSGFNHFIAETAHPMFFPVIAEKFNYGMFSARYGNIYTARQLKQLLQRTYGEFEPIEIGWTSRDEKSIVDPFRPQIQPGGFVSESELLADRQYHFESIRTAIEQMDVFVFTLGLTECWIDQRDGAVYPLAPGVAGGVYNPENVKFHNFQHKEVIDDLLDALNYIREKNPAVKFILTVSPVPLNATAEDRHVFVSTTLSKSILRIAAEEASQQLNQCDYFPSYEIITSPYSQGRYFGPDRRNVNEAGVAHVMRLFLKHYGGVATVQNESVENEPIQEAKTELELEQQAFDILCDEEAISNQ